MQETFCVLSQTKSYLFLVLFFLISATAFSQTKLKWGDIPQDQLNMEKCSFEEDAKAMVLIDQGEIEFNYQGKLNIQLHRHKRIKIFDKSATDQGDIKIKYYHKYKILSLKAQVVDKDGTITVLSKKQIFDERINKYYKSKNFALPNVQPGSVLEIKYTLSSPYISELFEWYFQDEIPVKHSELAVTIPREYDYIFLFQGNQSPEKTNLKGKYFFKMDDVLPLQEEAFITSMDNYRNRIRFQLAKYTPPQTNDGNVRDPITYMSDWEEINKQLMTNENLGRKLKVKKKKINEVYLSSGPEVGKMSDLEKVESIYQFVQSKMTWDGYYGITSKNKLDQVLESGTGSAQEINMILTILLKANGIASNMVVMPTRTSGKALELYPFADQFDYAISSAHIGEKSIFLDASGDMNPLGIMPVRAITPRGFMINDRKGKWVDIPIKQDKEVTYFKGAINTDGTVTGTWTKKLNAYSGAEAKKKYGLGGEGYVKSNLTNKFSDLDISDTKLEGLMTDSKKVSYSADISIPEACTVANDYLYLKPVMHSSFDENPFKMEVRKYPIDMPYPFVEKFVMFLKIPDRMEVEEMPEEVMFTLPDRSGLFTYSAKIMKGSIMIDSTLNFKRNSFSSDEYQAVKELFDEVISKNNEQIVFKIK